MKNASVLARMEGGVLTDSFQKIRRNFYDRIDPRVHAQVYSGVHDVTYAEPEFTGKYLDLCARYYATEGSAEALSLAMLVVDNIEQNQRADGHITAYAAGKETAWFGFWNQSFTVYGLSSLYAATGDARVLRIAERATDFLVDFFTRDGAPDILDAINQGSQHITCLHSVGRMYLLSGKKTYLDFIERVLAHCEQTDMNLLSFRDILALRSRKGIEMLVVYLGVLEYGIYADKPQAVEAARRYWRQIRDTQIRNTGNGTVVEFWTENGNADRFMPTEQKPNETCVAVGWCELSLSLFYHEPRAEYLDALEQTMLNHMLGSIDSEGSDFAYYQGNFGKKIFRKAEGLYQCCRYRGYTLFSYLPSFMYYDDGETVIPVLYGSSSYEKDGFRLTQVTEYPKEGSILFQTEGGARTLRLRVPAWCSSFAVRLDGVALSAVATEGFVALSLSEGKHRVELCLVLPLVVRRHVIENKPYFSYTKGPMLLAHDTRYGGDLSDPVSEKASFEELPPTDTLAHIVKDGVHLVDFASAGLGGEDSLYTVYIPEKAESNA